MLTIRRIHRPAIAALLAGALLVFAASGAQADDVTQRATAQERYYASYGNPERLTPAQSAGDTPWVPVALSLAVALLVASASATQIRRRRSVRVTT